MNGRVLTLSAEIRRQHLQQHRGREKNVFNENMQGYDQMHCSVGEKCKNGPSVYESEQIALGGHRRA
jgi:hypothetical protein